MGTDQNCMGENTSKKTTANGMWRVLWNIVQLIEIPVRDTNADLKISLYVYVHVKIITWKFRILNPKNSNVIFPYNLLMP